MQTIIESKTFTSITVAGAKYSVTQIFSVSENGWPDVTYQVLGVNARLFYPLAADAPNDFAELYVHRSDITDEFIERAKQEWDATLCRINIHINISFATYRMLVARSRNFCEEYEVKKEKEEKLFFESIQDLPKYLCWHVDLNADDDDVDRTSEVIWVRPLLESEKINYPDPERTYKKIWTVLHYCTDPKILGFTNLVEFEKGHAEHTLFEITPEIQDKLMYRCEYIGNQIDAESLNEE